MRLPRPPAQLRLPLRRRLKSLNFFRAPFWTPWPPMHRNRALLQPGKFAPALIVEPFPVAAAAASSSSSLIAPGVSSILIGSRITFGTFQPRLSPSRRCKVVWRASFAVPAYNLT